MHPLHHLSHGVAKKGTILCLIDSKDSVHIYLTYRLNYIMLVFMPFWLQAGCNPAEVHLEWCSYNHRDDATVVGP